MKGYQALKRIRKRAKGASSSAHTIGASDAAAQESAKQAKRAVTAAWFGVIVNVIVVAAAVLLPSYQRALVRFDGIVTSKDADKRMLIAGYSRLIDAARLVNDGGLLDPSQCEKPTDLNRVDRSRAAWVERNMTAFNQTMFQQPLTTNIQTAEQAMLIRVRDSTDAAFVTLREITHSNLPRERSVALCEEAIGDVVYQAKVLKSLLESDYALFSRRLNPPLFYDGELPQNFIILEGAMPFDQAVKDVPLPEIDEDIPSIGSAK